MSIKAEWRLAELDLGSDNPFDTVILTTGLTVNLTGDEADIHEGIRKTLDIEAHLFNRGVTCDLKDGGQDCLTCHEFTTDRAEDRMPLCRLGRDQQLLLHRAEAWQEMKHRPYRVLGVRYQDYAEISETYAALLATSHANEDRAFAAAVA